MMVNKTTSQFELFEQREADVRSYCRNFPAVFRSAQGATLVDVDGRTYIDFLSGAGTLNYGHNHPVIKQAVMQYITDNGVAHALDMYTSAKHDFIKALYEIILEPRKLGDYKVAFPGPTGTNAIELALKYARLATGRENVIAFTNAFHGMTLGSLALTGNDAKRQGAGVPLHGVTRMPYDGYAGKGVDTTALLEKMLSDPSSGVDKPAAIVVETVQGEGGLNVASIEWLQNIADIAHDNSSLLIVDDIQAGCGRTGTFFSFEDAKLFPDIVCLSKSLGGMGLPMSLLLLKSEHDVLKPGQHNGTFRGHNLAFVAATAALELWRDPFFERSILQKSETMRRKLEKIADAKKEYGAQVRGKGMFLGLSWHDDTIAGEVSTAAFQRQTIFETSGSRDEVLKLLPPLTISPNELLAGLESLEMAVGEVLDNRPISKDTCEPPPAKRFPISA